MPESDAPRYVVEPFRKGRHDRSSFSCGIESLDRYLHQQVTQDLKRKISAPFVLVEEGR